MSKTDVLRIPDYLEHIVEGIERINRYVENMSEKVDYELVWQTIHADLSELHQQIQQLIAPHSATNSRK